MSASAGDPRARLQALGLTLPVPPAPVAAYVPTITTPLGGGRVMLAVSGQVPIRDGRPVAIGRVPDEIDIDTAVECARLCGLNLLAQIEAAVGLDAVQQVLALTGYVRCADGFGDQPRVLNGASELLVEVLGDAGRHTRAAVGVNALPFGVPVEVSALVVAITADRS